MILGALFRITSENSNDVYYSMSTKLVQLGVCDTTIKQNYYGGLLACTLRLVLRFHRSFCIPINLVSIRGSLKNETGQGHWWGGPGWGGPGWGGPGMFPPPPPPPPPPGPWLPPPWWLIDDANVCTLDATILVVMGPPFVPPPNTGASIDSGPEVGFAPPPPPPGPCPGPFGCGNSIRMRCSDVATIDEAACALCCKHASRFGGFSKESIHGILIDSKALSCDNGNNCGASLRKKRSIGPGPCCNNRPPLPGCTAYSLPCPTTKCMCCGPRRPLLPPPPPPPPPPVWGPPAWGPPAWGPSIGEGPPPQPQYSIDPSQYRPQ
ncbi:unnamed protein product [Anisakis simplex]|uniref:Cysteine and tyrosine-rich protein 1 n=1 Tax=Anisakis simplex TaxID=6269 RepID=A0A0M3JVK7_ANISI|nr:unnamed protein product [Anisakis simplex]